MRNFALRTAVTGLMLMLALSAQSWAQSKNIHENVDPYSGLHTLFLEVSTRTCSEDPSPGEHDPEVHLLFSANENKDGTVYYFLTPTLDHGYTLNVGSKDTMDTLIDGLPGSFTTSMGSTVVTNYAGGRSYLHETIPFLVSPDDLANLSIAHWFQFRVNGPKRYIQRCVDAKHLRDLAEFLSAAAEYGPPQPMAPQRALPVDKVRGLPNLKLGNIATDACPGDPALGPQDADVHLVISANPHGDGNVWYFLSTDIDRGPKLNLDRGGEIQTKMGEKTSVFHTINGSVLAAQPDAAGASVVHETTAFHVHQPNLITLSESPMLEFRIVAAHQTLHRCVDAKNLQGLPKFIQDSTQLYARSVAAAQKP